jgi:hypothetical protein
VSLFILSKRLKIETIEDVFSTFAQMINNALVREKCLPHSVRKITIHTLLVLTLATFTIMDVFCFHFILSQQKLNIKYVYVIHF